MGQTNFAVLVHTTKLTCQFIFAGGDERHFPSLRSSKVIVSHPPAHKASGFPPIDRRLTVEEAETALEMLAASGLENGWTQEDDNLASEGWME